MMKINNKKGQLSIINIFYFVITVIITAVLTPITSSIIQSSILQSNLSDIDILVMNSVIVFMWIAVLMTIFVYMTPQRPNQY